MSGDLAGHVLYGNSSSNHLAENCSSKNVRTMLAKYVDSHLAGKLFHHRVEAQHTAATYSGMCLQRPSSQHT